MDTKGPAEAFLDLLVAAMQDAIQTGRCCQLQTQLRNDKPPHKMEMVRLIIVPEKMDIKFPQHAPLGTKIGSGN